MDTTAMPPVQHELTQEEKRITDSGEIIQAIKEVRNRTGLFLKEAKDLVDAYRYSNPLVRTVDELKLRVGQAEQTAAIKSNMVIALQSKIENLEGQVEAYHKIIKTLKVTIPKGVK